MRMRLGPNTKIPCRWMIGTRSTHHDVSVAGQWIRVRGTGQPPRPRGNLSRLAQALQASLFRWITCQCTLPGARNAYGVECIGVICEQDSPQAFATHHGPRLALPGGDHQGLFFWPPVRFSLNALGTRHFRLARRALGRCPLRFGEPHLLHAVPTSISVVENCQHNIHHR